MYKSIVAASLIFACTGACAYDTDADYADANIYLAAQCLTFASMVWEWNKNKDIIPAAETRILSQAEQIIRTFDPSRRADLADESDVEWSWYRNVARKSWDSPEVKKRAKQLEHACTLLDAPEKAVEVSRKHGA
jgi:hypothetical protein